MASCWSAGLASSICCCPGHRTKARLLSAGLVRMRSDRTAGLLLVRSWPCIQHDLEAVEALPLNDHLSCRMFRRCHGRRGRGLPDRLVYACADLDCCINVTCHLVSRVPPPQVPSAAQQVTAALTAKVRLQKCPVQPWRAVPRPRHSPWAALLCRICCKAAAPVKVSTWSGAVTTLWVCPQTNDRPEARLTGLVELYNVLTDAAARLSVLSALLAFARDADLAHHLLPVIQVILVTPVGLTCTHSTVLAHYQFR